MARRLEFMKKFFFALAVLVSTIIGGGIFALPYSFSKPGFFPALIFLIVLEIVNIVIMLAYAEVILRTKGTHHQITGYAAKYTGKTGKFAMLFSMGFGIYGALIVYTIGVGDFLFSLFGNAVGGSSRLYGVIFFAIASLLVIFGLKSVEKVDIILLFVLVGVIFLVFVVSISQIKVENLLYTNVNFQNLLFPFGVILFAIAGSSALPFLDDILDNQKRKMKSVIIAGNVLSMIIFIIFVVTVLGLSGTNTSEEAVSSLANYLHPVFLIAIIIFGIVAIATSFLALGVALREIYEYDYKIKKWLSIILVLAVPIAVYILDMTTFIRAISIVGSITGGIWGVIMIAMHNRAKRIGEKKPEFEIKIPFIFQVFIIMIYLGAILYELYYIFFNLGAK